MYFRKASLLHGQGGACRLAIQKLRVSANKAVHAPPGDMEGGFRAASHSICLISSVRKVFKRRVIQKLKLRLRLPKGTGTAHPPPQYHNKRLTRSREQVWVLSLELRNILRNLNEPHPVRRRRASVPTDAVTVCRAPAGRQSISNLSWY